MKRSPKSWKDLRLKSGLATSVIAELKSLQEVIQGAMTKGSVAEPYGMGAAEPPGMGAAEPCGMGPGEPCGMGIGEPCGIGVIPSGPIPAVGFPPPGPPGPPLPPPMAGCSNVGQIPFPLPSAAPSSVATGPQTPLSWVRSRAHCLRRIVESATTVGLVDAEIPERKAVPVLLKCQNRLLTASPTARQGRQAL